MINDEESDLTEIEDSDEDDQPLTSKYPTPVPPPQPLTSQHSTSVPPPPQFKAKHFKKIKAGPRLDEPHLYPDTIQTIYNELKNKIIDVDPEYQRNVVWDDTKQGYLIDSLMNNYVVFPLVFAERIGEDETMVKVCIDGKQRITAIQQFIEGKISYRDSQLNREIWYEKIPAGKKGVVFTPTQRQRFNGVRISICKYREINEHDEREVFQRVQNGVALSTHERLKAVNGPNGDLVREMYRRTSVGLRGFLGWEKAKGKDFFMLGQIAVIIKEIIAKNRPPATQITLTRVETFLNLKTAPANELSLGALAVIEAFNLIHESPQLVDVLQNIQPPFFVMAGAMIHLHRKTHSVAQLADAVRQMKKCIQPDTAAKLYKKLLMFVTDKVPSLQLKGQSLSVSNRCPPTSASSNNVSMPAVTRTPASAATPKRKQTTQATPKRKRVTKGDDGKYSPEATTQLTKRRRVPALRFSDDEGDGASTLIRCNPRKESVTPRPVIADAAKASGSVSKAQTSVRSKTTVTTPSSTASKRTPPSASSNRLGPLWRAKEMIQLQGFMEPHPCSHQPSHRSQSSTPSDNEVKFQLEVDKIGNMLRSSATAACPSANSSNSLSPMQQQQPSAAPPPDITLADGPTNKSILHGRVSSFQRRDNFVPARKMDQPPFQGKPVSHPSVPSIHTSSTNINPSPFRNTSASTSTPTLTPVPLKNSKQDKTSPQPAPAVTAATLTEQKVPYHQMPPIRKLPSQPSPTIPARTPETQSGTRNISRSLQYESRYYRPSPRYDPERLKRDLN
ncbi:hypothetical protein E4T56_gene11691 [Termitomyces sp. T112]|nr:hypothetical protein E4T56_gene11691 [Termitomyces sp. T112]